jgi:hypothetical protein
MRFSSVGKFMKLSSWSKCIESSIFELLFFNDRWFTCSRSNFPWSVWHFWGSNEFAISADHILCLLWSESAAWSRQVSQIYYCYLRYRTSHWESANLRVSLRHWYRWPSHRSWCLCRRSPFLCSPYSPRTTLSWHNSRYCAPEWTSLGLNNSSQACSSQKALASGSDKQSGLMNS